MSFLINSVNMRFLACRALGYSKATSITSGSLSNYPILLDNVDCDDDSASLTVCGHNGFYNHNCDHTEDINITCE